ncbi:MAG: ceramidase domain-containing protein [bacterium]
MTLFISIAIAIGGTVIVGIALREIFRSLNPALLSGYRPCKGGWWEAELNNCSLGLKKLPQQPVNTYTNVAYVTGGLFLMFTLNTLPTYVLSLTLLYLCAGSALYHATSTRWAGSLDASAMYALFSALTAYAAFRFLGLTDALAAFLMILVATLAGYFLRYKYRGNMSLKIGVFLVLTYAFLIWNMLRSQQSLLNAYLIGSFALFAVAYLIWNLDKARSFPLRRWGHGLWHVLTAAAIAMLYYVTHQTL